MAILNNDLGIYYPKGAKWFGYFLGVKGLAWTISGLAGNTGIIIGPICLLIGTYLAFSRYGVQFDPLLRTYREYRSYLGLKWGSWKSYELYPDMAVLRKNMTTRTESRHNIVALTEKKTVYDICLLSQNHRKKLIVKQLSSSKLAQTHAKELAQELGLRFTTFSPAISAKTRARRR